MDSEMHENQLETVSDNLPSQFKPRDYSDKAAKTDAVIAYAKRVKDWDLLEEAARMKIEELKEFVGWWDGHVGRPGGEGGGVMTGAVITLSTEEAENLTGFTVKQISRIRCKLKDEDKFRSAIMGAAYLKAFPDALRGVEGTGDNEWYTPDVYVVAAREVLGTIDLDPASSVVANEVVGAAKYYTETDNGLIHPWNGKVWMNPPYAQPLIQEFTQKLVDEVVAGNVTEAISLTHNYTDTAWFHAALPKASAICFTRGRVKFEKPCGEKASATQGQVFFYYGDNPKKFEEIFNEFGAVLYV